MPGDAVSSRGQLARGSGDWSYRVAPEEAADIDGTGLELTIVNMLGENTGAIGGIPPQG